MFKNDSFIRIPRFCYSTALGAEIRSGRAGRVYSRRSPQIWAQNGHFGGFWPKPPKNPHFGGYPKNGQNGRFSGYKLAFRALLFGSKTRKSVFDKGGEGPKWPFWAPPGPPKTGFLDPPGRGGKPPKMAILGVSPPPPHFGGFWPKPPKTSICHMAAPRVNPPARPDLIPAPAAVL